ncbi:MAG TPA: glycogen synthase GlgA [Acetobacteraceae bacterium]|jgi:starch synthase|nr:glycogen synthase GlgA [Acetobacteraceae bacterium]
MIRVLSVVSEMFPVVKTGGLGDVAGALPAALAAAGAETTTMLPGYPAVIAALTDATAAHEFADLFGGPATVLRGSAAGLDVLVVDAPHLYARAGNPYLGADGREWADNGLRFAGLGAAGAAMAAGVAPGHDFDIVHAHDWQAAMAIVYLNFHPGERPGTVLTVHNLAFQGLYPAALFPRLGLPESAFSLNGLEYHGKVNFLKGGLSYADRITTVSPTYAQEIMGVENGMGLDGILRHRADVLSGIMNGIDDTIWNPATDPLIPGRFGRGKMARRALNKAALQQRMGLDQNPDALLIGLVTRMTTQKGLDMLVDLLDDLAADGIQLALLGAGDPDLEHAFVAAAEWNLGSVGCVIGYDETLAHLIEAGSDAFLAPSRFEPCGLTQLYALRYGAVPVVSRVGGLADSVIDANQAALAAGVATGIQFWPATPEALQSALHRLMALWRDKQAWERMQRNGMAADVSWRGPASRYVALYKSLLAERG